MIADLKPYPAYKDSGVPWLGKVPEKWEVLPALATYKPKLVKNTGMVEKTVLSLSYGRIIVKPVEKLRGLVPESFETYQIVNPGNIIVRTTDLQNDHTSLRIGHSRNRGIITSAYLCLETTDRVSTEFGYQFLNTYDLLKIIYGFGSGLRQNLDFVDIKRMPVLVPPKDEQSSIVRFLDHADRRIRRYILAKQKLIKLLEEQKQAIIHRAVTRGLDPNVRLKPSGVEWLGDVPEHWEVMPLRHLLSLGPKNGVSPPSSGTGGVLSFSISAVRDGRIRIKGNEKYVDLDAALVPGFCISMGDILLVRGNGNVALVAKCGLVDEYPDNCIYPDILMKLRPNSRMASDFMVLAINSPYVSNQVLLLAKTTNGTFKVSGASVRSLVLAVPPRSEQEMILEYLLRVLADVNRAKERAGNEISVLREYRTRLIADVVTGKLDVRAAAAAKLPEKTDESEPPDDAEALVEGDENIEDADLDAVPDEAEA